MKKRKGAKKKEEERRWFVANVFDVLLEEVCECIIYYTVVRK